MSEVIKYQMVYGVILQIIICLFLIRSFYHYFGKEKLSGEILRKVYGSRMRALIHTVYFFVMVVICGRSIWQSLSSKLLCLCGWICFRKDSVRMVL